MKKRTTALALVLIGAPAVLTGCGSSDECDPQTDEGCTTQNGRSGYYGGYHGGAFRGGGSRGGGTSAGRSTRGGFGSFGHSIFSGG